MCIHYLAEMTQGLNYEVIIVDNGSADETPSFLQSLKGDVQVITNSSNRGFAKASNQGALKARGRHLLFLNNDTLPQGGWLSELMSTLEERSRIGIAGSKLLYPDGSIQHAGIAFNKKGIPYLIYQGLHPDHPAVNRMRELQAVTAACMLVRKDLFFGIGGFDETYKNGLEDVDLCLKARERNWKIVYNPLSVLYHFEETTPGRKRHDAQNLAAFTGRWRGKIISDEDRIAKEDGLRVVYDRQGRFYWVYNLDYINRLRVEGKTHQALRILRDTYHLFSKNPYIPQHEKALLEKALRLCGAHAGD